MVQPYVEHEFVIIYYRAGRVAQLSQCSEHGTLWTARESGFGPRSGCKFAIDSASHKVFCSLGSWVKRGGCGEPLCLHLTKYNRKTGAIPPRLCTLFLSYHLVNEVQTSSGHTQPPIRRLPGVNHPPLYSPEVEERVELYLYSSSRLSWQVIGRTLFF